MQRMNAKLERLENDDVTLTEKEVAELRKTVRHSPPIEVLVKLIADDFLGRS